MEREKNKERERETAASEGTVETLRVLEQSDIILHYGAPLGNNTRKKTVAR